MKRSRLASGLVASLHLTPILLAVPIVVPARDALAHALVESSQPAAHATVPRGELRISLRFNSRIDAARSRVALRAPDDRETAVATVPDPSRAVLTGHAQVDRTGPWMLRWQVLSVDGHVTRGEIPFRVENSKPAS
jgi:methionine-rich copper-binding protein CopC